jgi:hypothetical protein
LDFERGASASELGKPGAAVTGMAGGNFELQESFALLRGLSIYPKSKIQNSKFNIFLSDHRRG